MVDWFPGGGVPLVLVDSVSLLFSFLVVSLGSPFFLDQSAPVSLSPDWSPFYFAPSA